MIYRIVYNKQEIYGPTLDQAVLNPTLEIELNSAGKLEFTLPVTRSTTEDDNGNKIYPDDIWTNIQVFRGEVEVWEEDECIWYGRPLQIIRDWNNQKRVVCEGALAYFNDSIQPTKEYKINNTVLYASTDYPNSAGFFNKLIERHNDQLRKDDANSSARHFKVGTIDVENSKIYRKTDFQTTAECLQSMCLDTDGGYFILRKEFDQESDDYVNVIDWRKAAPYGTSQEIQFGVNLLDINQDLNGSDLCTVLYPTSGDDIFVDHATKYTEEDPYEVKDDNNNVTGHVMHEHGADKYITHIEGYKKYGRVVKVKNFDIVEIEDSDPDYQHKNSQALFKKAAKWLNDQNQEELTIECSAADLHYLTYDEDYSSKERLKLGQMVQVIDDIHDVTRELPIFKVSMNLDSGIKKITMGTPPKKELTDIVKTSTSSSTRGSSGSSGGGNADTGGSGGGSSGSSVDIPVIDVKVKNPGDTKYTSVVNNKTAKINLTGIVEANPSETASVDMSKIKVGSTTYGVATPSDIQTLQTNFQAGVDSIYDACVAKGSTPASHSLSDVVDAILAISGGGGAGSIREIYSRNEWVNNLDDTFTYTCPANGKIVVAETAYVDGITLIIDGVTYPATNMSGYWYALNGVFNVTQNSVVSLRTYGTGNCGIDAKVFFVSGLVELDTKNITQNGTYNASSDNLDGYSQVNVSVSPNVGTKSITQDGTYNASSDNLDGYSQVVVNVSGGGGGTVTKIYEKRLSTSNIDDTFTYTCPSSGKLIIAETAYVDNIIFTIDGVQHSPYNISGYWFSLNGDWEVSAGSSISIRSYGSGTCHLDIKVYLVS